eukprot:Gb_25904 [translate_table: standard]
MITSNSPLKPSNREKGATKVSFGELTPIHKVADPFSDLIWDFDEGIKELRVRDVALNGVGPSVVMGLSYEQGEFGGRSWRERENIAFSAEVSDCPGKCGGRCALAGREDRCMRYCLICCEKCQCVPSGTYGHKEECPCYANMKTSKGRDKCP